MRRPTSIPKTGHRKLVSIAAAHAPRLGDKLVTAIMAALEDQTVTVPAPPPWTPCSHRLADSLKTVLAQHKQVAS